MAKTKISQYDATAGNNTDIDSISIAEGMAPSNVNNAIRELMAHLKDMDAGTQALTSPQLTSVDINGGTIDGAVIGANSAAAITGTTITGTSLVIGSANINENDFESIDGITAGTVAASKAVIVDANKDVTGFRNVTLTGELDAATLDVSGDIDVDGTANLDVVDIDGAVDMASTLGVAGVVTANAGVVVDNITIDGTEIDLSSGDLTLDVAGDIILDADGGDIFLNNAGTTFAKFTDNSGHLDIFVPQTNGDILFKGNDDGATITALTLDMSDAGTAIFNHDIFLPDAGEIQLGNGFDFRFFHDGSNNYIKSVTSDQDIIIQGNDGGNIINALTLDLSDAGTAIFNHDAQFPDGTQVRLGADNDMKLHLDGTTAIFGAQNGDMLLDSAGSIELNADSGNVVFADAGVTFGQMQNGSGSQFIMQGMVADQDMIFKINNGGSTINAILVDSIGAVTKPNQPAFLARPTSAQNNVTEGSSTTVVFGTEVFDQGSDFSSNTFTAPVTGRYQLSTIVYLGALDTDADYTEISIMTSNRNYHAIVDPGVFASDPVYWAFTVTCLADMDASDTAYVRYNQVGGSTQTDLKVDSFFSGFLAC